MLMQTLTNTPPSFLLLTASKVNGIPTSTTTAVTLYGIGPIPENRSQVMTTASAVAVDAGGGTVYEEEIVITKKATGTQTTSPTTTTFTGKSSASNWLYEVTRPEKPPIPNEPNDLPGGFNQFGGGEWNCTLEEGVDQGKCIAEISWEEMDASSHIVGFLDQTTTYIGQMIPMYTLTGPVPTPTTTTMKSAETILGNPIFNRLSSILLGIFIVVVLVLDF